MPRYHENPLKPLLILYSIALQNSLRQDFSHAQHGGTGQLKCPHCLVAFNAPFNTVMQSRDPDGMFYLNCTTCPECKRISVLLSRDHTTSLLYPRGASRPPLSQHVPEPYATDYREACLTLPDSPKASAALSRRSLQHLIRSHFTIQKPKLSKEIEALLASNALPPYLATAVDAIRQVGNLAAHPTKDSSTGEIIEVEPQEAEWLLDTLEHLYEFCFVQPKITQEKWDALNAKTDRKNNQ